MRSRRVPGAGFLCSLGAIFPQIFLSPSNFSDTGTTVLVRTYAEALARRALPIPHIIATALRVLRIRCAAVKKATVSGMAAHAAAREPARVVGAALSSCNPCVCRWGKLGGGGGGGGSGSSS